MKEEEEGKGIKKPKAGLEMVIVSRMVAHGSSAIVVDDFSFFKKKSAKGRKKLTSRFIVKFSNGFKL